MTRTFVKLNWDKIISIDNSTGTSISQKYFPDNYGSDNAIYYNHIPRLIIILDDFDRKVDIK